ncbi:unnamed protein product [Heligmosomoides polygyrus]|uniref:DUF1534 domain-containing protein n=1 Tax=Heligmosomoides polygyrus TaxID=6339 RepID=A0A183FYE0_HELPZ|nr:unnamed protein product [Heligmosomoides polygyrus]
MIAGHLRQAVSDTGRGERNVVAMGATSNSGEPDQLGPVSKCSKANIGGHRETIDHRLTRNKRLGAPFATCRHRLAGWRTACLLPVAMKFHSPR